jgi:hypothetical protein
MTAVSKEDVLSYLKQGLNYDLKFKYERKIVSIFGVIRVYFDSYTTPLLPSVTSRPIKYHHHDFLTPPTPHHPPPNSHIFCGGTYFRMLYETVAPSFCVEFHFQNYTMFTQTVSVCLYDCILVRADCVSSGTKCKMTQSVFKDVPGH